MPANLSPEYKDADAAYRQAKDPAEKLRWLERMLATIPKHKGTEKMQADLKTRIARLKDDQEKSSGKKGFSIKVDPAGAAQVALVGAPNAGKSALVEATTNARVEVTDFPFGTREPVPAMFEWEHVQFQLVDLPPVCREFQEAFVTDIIRNADSALWVLDASDPDGLQRWVDEVPAVLAEKKIELVGDDGPFGARHEPVRRLPTRVLAAKSDADDSGRGLAWIQARLGPRYRILALSALGDRDFAQLGRALFDLNRLMRVFSKPPGKEADRTKPFVIPRGSTLIDFAARVHKDFAEELAFARVWGPGKFDGQRIQRDQELSDGDLVELHR
jgi:hypothetical protein